MDDIVMHKQAGNPADGISAGAASVAQDSLWTLVAFGALAYMISNVLHEGLGHGGVAWLSGARNITVTSTYMEAGMETRWILAAGTLANLAAGAIGWLVLRGLRRASMPIQLFVWIVTTFNLLLAMGYFCFSGVAGIGDWAEWMKGLSPMWAWRVGFSLLGVASYAAACWLLGSELARIAGPGASESRMRRMTLAFYLAGGLIACFAGMWNPMGWKLVLVSAAASSFGGAAGLHNIPGIAAKAARRMPSTGAIAAPLPKMPLLWLAAAVAMTAYVWFLGPGVTLHLPGRG